MAKMIDVTIRMPKDWFDHFWNWYVDGAGRSRFTKHLDLSDCQEEGDWSNANKDRRLVVHAKNLADVRQAMEGRCAQELISPTQPLGPVTGPARMRV